MFFGGGVLSNALFSLSAIFDPDHSFLLLNNRQKLKSGTERLKKGFHMANVLISFKSKSK